MFLEHHEYVNAILTALTVRGGTFHEVGIAS